MARRSTRLDPDRVEALRKARGFRRQQDLALAAGVDATTISRIERGQSVSQELAEKVSDSLGLSVADLAVESDSYPKGSPARRPAIDAPPPAAIRNPMLRLAFYDLDALNATEEELGPVYAAYQEVKAAKERELGVGGRGRGGGASSPSG